MVLLDIFSRLVTLTIDVVMIAMLARMLLSFFADMAESRMGMFLAIITEPFIAPVRFFMIKFNLLQDSPIDWSFTLTSIILGLIRVMLPVI